MPLLILVGGDLLVLFLFVLLGRQDHDMTFSLLAALPTAIPFALGWVIALAVVRTYRPSSVSSVGKAVLYALLTCCLAVPLGLVLRSLWLGRLPTGTFAVVAFPLIASFMIVWRALCALLFRRAFPGK
ncbi:DUF3054 domain-containing protein [Paenibacillus hemerocallicola]|uniref:DUF3054 domain-containing protein n=1 Tax=Paenibacillus hemerocallicola TaxID=1172614 RepID=A0A5C4TAB5_9BACL|nr:DUF3054 domain-containing protein [Paenibacillus hemerocallicola]TNJ65359.1 DUF3054 domain-containing protein [Paenibacillus hemerocallicola]